MRKPVRVFVVDDFAPWRGLIGRILQSDQDLQVICGVSDGLEAVHKAAELQADLILLDIGLPTLNGIEAARQIRKVAPQSKILFVTENISVELARASLLIGGRGFVVKSDAGGELLPAIKAVVEGKQFVSARLANQLSRRVGALDRTRIQEVLDSFAGRIPRNQDGARHHEAHFYADDTVLLNGLTRFFRAALQAGDVIVALATESHRATFVEAWNSCGIDAETAAQSGTFTLLDAEEAISGFAVNDWVNPVRYLEGLADLVESVLRTAGPAHRRVAACGELTAPFLARGNVNAVMDIEQLSDKFANQYELGVLCMYPVESLSGEEPALFDKICGEHSTVHVS